MCDLYCFLPPEGDADCFDVSFTEQIVSKFNIVAGWALL